jgi:hypothetical protein
MSPPATSMENTAEHATARADAAVPSALPVTGAGAGGTPVSISCADATAATAKSSTAARGAIASGKDARANTTKRRRMATLIRSRQAGRSRGSEQWWNEAVWGVGLYSEVSCVGSRVTVARGVRASCCGPDAWGARAAEVARREGVLGLSARGCPIRPSLFPPHHTTPHHISGSSDDSPTA